MMIGLRKEIEENKHLVVGLLKGLRKLKKKKYDVIYGGIGRDLRWSVGEERIMDFFIHGSSDMYEGMSFLEDREGNICGTGIVIRDVWEYDVTEFYEGNERGECVVIVPGTRIRPTHINLMSGSTLQASTYVI